MSERACTNDGHKGQSRLAETTRVVTKPGVTFVYVQLRCPVCERPRGVRRFRKVTA